MKTEERIDKDAYEYERQHNFEGVFHAFLNGAKSERNKTIDEIIDIIDQPWQTTNADAILNYIESEIKKLKI